MEKISHDEVIDIIIKISNKYGVDHNFLLEVYQLEKAKSHLERRFNITKDLRRILNKHVK